MTDHLLRDEADPPRYSAFRDVGRFLEADDNWAWVTRTASLLVDEIRREGQVTDEYLIQHYPFPPDYAGRHAFDESLRTTVYYLEVAPVLATHTNVEWLDAWRLADDAPEPGTDAWRAATEDVNIPRETRSSEWSTFSTEVYAGYVKRAYEHLYNVATADDRPVSGYELYHANPTFQFKPDQYAEVMDFFAQIDGVIPPANRDEYHLSPLVRETERYIRTLDGTATEDETDWLREQVESEPYAWRYVDDDAVNAEAETNAEGTA